MKFAYAFISSILTVTSAYNILAIFNFPARSTLVTFAPLFRELAERGHNITVVSNIKFEGIKKNYRNIILGGDAHFTGTETLSNLAKIPHGRLDKYMSPRMLENFSEKLCSVLFESKEVEDLYKKQNKFDLVVVDIFQTECAYQIAKQFKCPIIGLRSSIMISWSGDRFALPNNPSYIPNNFLPFSSKMSFWERFENALVTRIHFLYYTYILLAKDKKKIIEYYGAKEASELESVIYNTSLFLVNNHYTLNLPRPMVPSVVEIGGIHVGQPKLPPKVL